jgi:hypothetical protein
MTVQLLSPEAFHKMVKEMIQEAVKEEMLKEFKALEEATAGTISSSPSISTVGTSSSTGTTGTKPSVGSKPGNDDPANNVMIPGTNMNINQALQAAAKEPNFKKKADLTTKITNQIAGMKGVVIKEEIEGMGMSVADLKNANKIEIRKFPNLVNRITNLVYYGDKPDEEILADLGPEVSENPKMVRWAKFIADMVRKGKDVMEESRKKK